MGDEDGAPRELEEARQDRPDPRRRGHHARGDPGEHADVGRDLPTRVDQGLELAEHRAAPHLHGADLGDRAVLRRAAGGLEVDDDERDLGQSRADVVDGHLLVADRLAPHGGSGDGHGRTVGRGGDSPGDARRGPARGDGCARRRPRPPGERSVAARLACRSCAGDHSPGGALRAGSVPEQRWCDVRALPVAHPSCGLARARRCPGRARPLGSARGAGRGRPERPAGWYVGSAGQSGTRRAAAAGGRRAGRSPGPAAGGHRGPEGPHRGAGRRHGRREGGLRRRGEAGGAPGTGRELRVGGVPGRRIADAPHAAAHRR